MNDADVFFAIGKGEMKGELLELRPQIFKRMSRPGTARRTGRPPARPHAGRLSGRSTTGTSAARACEASSPAAVDGVGGILVWGDPSLYDSTLRMVDGCARGWTSTTT